MIIIIIIIMLLHLLPVIGTISYLSYPTYIKINPNVLFFISVLHNSFLIAFSAWTFISLSRVLLDKGIVFGSKYYFNDPQFDKIIYYFYLSKYYEYIDTFIDKICEKLCEGLLYTPLFEFITKEVIKDKIFAFFTTNNYKYY